METAMTVLGIALLVLNIVLIVKFFDLCRNVETLTAIANELIRRHSGTESDSSAQPPVGNISYRPPSNKRGVKVVDIIVCVIIGLIILTAIVSSLSQ